MNKTIPAIKLFLIILLFLFSHFAPLSAVALEPGENNEQTTDFLLKILGGTESKSGDWPWIAALLQADNTDIYQAQFCSGVLIDDAWVLTAAHCVYGKQSSELDVAVGAFDLKNFSGSRISVKHINIHPLYDHVSHINDIALLELNQSSSQPKVTLFSGKSQENLSPYLLGKMLTAIGWGMADSGTNWYYPSKLRQVNLPVVSNTYCNASYPYTLLSSQLCAGYFSGKDVCNGDSGGPIITEIDGKQVHVGLVSYGMPCADYQGWYGVYTRTSEFVDFIKCYTSNANFTSSENSRVPNGNIVLSSLNIEDTGPLQAGEPVTVTAEARALNGSTVYYKFYYCADYGTDEYENSPWVEVQDYSTTNSADYTFPDAGNYIIVVRAVTDPAHEPTALPVIGQAVVVGDDNQVSLTGMTTDAADDTQANDTVNVTATASCPVDQTLYYEFYYCANYGTDAYETTAWTLVQPYSTSNTCQYTFPEDGDYIIVVRAVTDPANEPSALPIVGNAVAIGNNSCQ